MLGCTDGKWVGFDDGIPVGTELGVCVVGKSLGVPEGSIDGTELGAEDGDNVGLSDRMDDGPSVGIPALGCSDGLSVG